MLMLPEDYDKKINEETSKQKQIEEQLNKTRINILRTIKKRTRVEKEYLDAIKNQMGYWKNQLDVTNPEKDKERYDRLKKILKEKKPILN